MLQHVIEYQSGPVCGLLAGNDNCIDQAQALSCTKKAGHGCCFDETEFKDAMDSWKNDGLSCTGIYYAGISDTDVAILEVIGKLSVDRLWKVRIDTDIAGRMEIRAFQQIGDHAKEMPVELFEGREMQALYPEGACD